MSRSHLVSVAGGRLGNLRELPATAEAVLVADVDMAWVDMVGTWGCAPTADAADFAVSDVPAGDVLDGAGREDDVLGGDVRTALLSDFEGDFEGDFKSDFAADFGADFGEVRPNAFGEDFAEAVLATLRDLAGLRDGIGRLTAPHLREECGAVADSCRWVTPPSGKSCIDTRNGGSPARVWARSAPAGSTAKATSPARAGDVGVRGQDWAQPPAGAVLGAESAIADAAAASMSLSARD